MKKLLTILIVFQFTTNLFSQDKEIIKLWNNNFQRQADIQSNSEEIDKVIKKIDSLEKVNEKLRKEIEIISEKDDIRKSQLDTSLSIYGNSTSGISNKLETLSIVIGIIGLVLAILGIGLGIYIKNKEEAIKKLLKESNENLEAQKKSQVTIEEKVKTAKEETEKLKDSIDKNVHQLYQKLKDEELKEIVESLNASPIQIRNHVSRLITLNVPEDNFLLFKNMLFGWDDNPENYTNIEYLLVFMVNRFPNKMAANQQVSPLIMRHWEFMGRRINFDRLEDFLDAYINAFFNNKYQNIDKDVARILSKLSTWYNFKYIASKTLFEKYTNKEHRFKLLQLMLDENLLELLMQYKQDMLNNYLNANNSKLQNELLKKVNPQKQEEKKK